MVFEGFLKHVEIPFCFSKFYKLDVCYLNGRSSAVGRVKFTLRAYNAGKTLFACRKEKVPFFTTCLIAVGLAKLKMPLPRVASPRLLTHDCMNLVVKGITAHKTVLR